MIKNNFFQYPRISSDQSFNPYIHGLRGLAAFMVVLYHIYRGAITAGEHHFSGARNFWPTDFIHAYLAPFFQALNAGVDCFFMISGFLIVSTLLHHRSIKQFAINRALRLYPAFLPPMLLSLILGTMIGRSWMANLAPWNWIDDLVVNMLFLPGFFNFHLALDVAWTLSFEAVFYVTAAMLFVISQTRFRKIIYFLIPLLFVYSYIDKPIAQFFFAGAATYFLGKKFENTRGLFIPGLPLLCFALFLILNAHRGGGDLANLIICMQMFCGFIFFRYLTAGIGVLATLMKTSVMQFLGTISYSLYLWHTTVLFVVKRLCLPIFHLSNNDYLILYSFAVLGIMGSVLVSFISYKLFEENIREKMQKISIRYHLFTKRNIVEN